MRVQNREGYTGLEPGTVVANDVVNHTATLKNCCKSQKRKCPQDDWI